MPPDPSATPPERSWRARLTRPRWDPWWLGAGHLVVYGSNTIPSTSVELLSGNEKCRCLKMLVGAMGRKPVGRSAPVDFAFFRRVEYAESEWLFDGGRSEWL